MKKNWKKVAIVIVVMVLGIGGFFFLQNGNKNLKNGNTMDIQTDEELERYILNISAYKAQVTVSIQSNKTTNRYKMIQEYEKNGIQRMIIEEPENRKGIEIVEQEGTVTVKNTNLGLSSLYEQEEVTGNRLWLDTFLEEYQKDENRSRRKTEEETIFSATVQTKHPYYQYTELHVDNKTKKPTQLIVQDKDKNNRIYILYNEMEIYS